MRRAFVGPAVVSLLLCLVPACGDLVVDNPNEPDLARALANPADVEALVANAWGSWWYPTYHFIGGGAALSTMAFQHSTSAACQSGVQFSSIPRQPVRNSPDWPYYGYLSLGYEHWYRAIAAVNDGLRVMLVNRTVTLGEDEPRAVAWGRFVQGMGYGYLALLYSGGAVVDETTDLQGPRPPYVDYREMMEAALGYLDEAMAIARANAFEIPGTWHFMVPKGERLTSAEFVQLISSYKARLRAAVARTPQERQAVDWHAVLSDIENGITNSLYYHMEGSGFSYNWTLYYMLLPGAWGQMSYFVSGMADQSGRYQEWMNTPLHGRHPNLPSGPFLIQTPDLRFPQGETAAEQRANPGTRHVVAENPGHQWVRPDRGTWRWSYYRHTTYHMRPIDGFLPEMSLAEMDLLAAEAHYRLGNRAAAADLINMYRVPAGLNATDADGVNISCVPKLPMGNCGDLFEMLKWEKRMNTGMDHALLSGAWFFDSRGWGDLHQGTLLQRPIPYGVAELDGLPILDYGGSLEWGAPMGTYGY